MKIIHIFQHEDLQRHPRQEGVDIVFLSLKQSPRVGDAAVLPYSSFTVFFAAARVFHRPLPSSLSLVIMAAEGEEKPQETKQEVTEEKAEESPKESPEEEKEAPGEEKETPAEEKETPAEEKETPAEGEETASEEEEAPTEEEEAPAEEEEEEEEEEEVVDPKPEIEDGCKPKCVKQLLAYQACERRIEEDEEGQKHCTGQYFDYWGCIDKCTAPKLFRKLK